MLTRAARRHKHLRLSGRLISSYEQLHLPWLCPAISSPLAQHRQLSDSSRPPNLHRRRSRSSSTKLISDHVPPSRNLATLAEALPHDANTDYIPFQSFRPAQSVPDPIQLWQQDIFNSIKPNITSKLYEQPTIRALNGSGFIGNISDQMSHLMACVHVGRLDRAAKLVRQLTGSLKPDVPEVAEAHFQYLTAELEALLLSPSRDKLARMQKWYELDLKARNVPVTAAVYAVMIKAALCTLSGGKLERTVRRYLSQAREAGDDTEHYALSSPIFTESEWSRVIRMQPDLYDNPELEVGTVEESVAAAPSPEDPTLVPGGYADSEAPLTTDLPDIRATEQKGYGLTSLRQSLASLLVPSSAESAKTEFSAEEARQARLEEDVLASAIEKWRNESEITKEMRMKGRLNEGPLGALVHEWIEAMQIDLRKELDEAQTAENEPFMYSADLQNFVPFIHLKMAPVDKLCGVTVLAFFNALVDSPSVAGNRDVPWLTVAGLARKIGAAVAAQIRQQIQGQKTLYEISGMPSEARSKILAKLRKEGKLPSRMHKSASTEGIRQMWENFDTKLPQTMIYKLGASMLSILLRAAKISQNGETTSLMAHGFVLLRGKRIGVVHISEKFMEKLKQEPVSSFLAKYLPMVIPPRPWTGLSEGAYLKTPTPAVRMKDTSGAQMDYLQIAQSRGDLKQVFSGLDVIGSVAWRINGPVFKAMCDVWNTGEQIAGFAPSKPRGELPPEPSFDDKEAHYRWRVITREMKNERTGFHSKRCYQNFQMEIAKAYLNQDFYAPHSMDFRGRAYPVPPYFHHMGADTVRGLFLFAKGKPLGEHGLRWLKIHVANTFGYDKQSLDDRAAFAMDNIADIYDSVENPLTGRRWWLEAGDPWQCLAACHELKNALDSPVPQEFVSHLPIQQDGSCNGLQHYAALGGDEIGARQVNLAPGDKPADIYTAVADLVIKAVDRDAAAGDKSAQLLQGRIVRKVVKQTVMTSVYGVTPHGASLQVRKQLVEILPKATMENQINLNELSFYVSTLILQALGDMFGGAQAIQKWLLKCGSQISSLVTPEQVERLRAQTEGTYEVDESLKKLKRKLNRPEVVKLAKEDYQFKSTIIWTTPLGLPVVQPYREIRSVRIKTVLQDIIAPQVSNTDPVSKRKQLQGFPPNFIHSLDATHMMMSAIKCKEVGVTFASVHDSFWTHACDIPVMNRILRDAFVRMHSEDITTRLYEEFQARYQGCMQWRSVGAYSEVGKKIVDWMTSSGRKRHHYLKDSLHQQSQVDDLLSEAERQRLLKSSDPKEQQKGKEMVTAASIYEASRTDDDDLGLPIRSIFDITKPKIADDVLDSYDEPDYLTSEITELDKDSSEDVLAPELDEALDLDPLSAGDEASAKPAEIEEHDEPGKKKRKPRSKSTFTDGSQRRERIYFWAPMELPEPPAKGTFDVRRLRDSQYFFS